MTIRIGHLANETEGIRCDRASILSPPFIVRDEISREVNQRAFRQVMKLIYRDMIEPIEAVKAVSKIYKVDISPLWPKPSRSTFLAELNRINTLSQTTDITLLCWCAPLDCHCQILINFMEEGSLND
jgi:Domain of unknown function (DUF4326)